MAATRDEQLLDTSFHDRWLAEQMEDPVFREEFERAKRETEAVDRLIRALDDARVELGMSKAELARRIGKNPAAVRRLLTSQSNPELKTVVAMAEAVGVDLMLRPRKRPRASASA